jgi:peptidoglycan/LPS O-acetylase OafA/YrhL
MSPLPQVRGSGRRIVEIDGLRGVSILMVLIGHLVSWRYAEYFSTLAVQIGAFLSNLGVELFFVISGFVITHLSLAEYRIGTFSIKHFYLRRAIRIIPPCSAT